MKLFGSKQFIRENYTIPNSDSDLVLKDVEFQYRSSYTISGISITFRGVKLGIIGKYWRTGVYSEPNVEAAIAFGFLPEDYDIDRGNYGQDLIDGIYSYYNPARFRSLRSGKLLASFYRELYRRVDHGYMHAKTTQAMIKELKAALQEKYDQPETPAGSIAYNVACDKDLKSSINGVLRICLLTGTMDHRNRMSHATYQNENVCIYNLTHINLNDYNLTLHGDYLLHPNEMVWNDEVHDISQGTCTCPTCNSEVPRTAIIAPSIECTRCEKQHYKIHNYSTRVPDLLKFKAKNVKPKQEPLYFGIELEYETSNRDKAAVKVGRLLKGHAIMKSDGSIRHGFEVVTCPATIDIHLDEFDKFFKDIPEELQIAPNVGMHIHVSKKPLSLFTIGKLTAFMNREINKRFIEFVAGRNSNSYCRLDSKRTVTFPWTNKSSERYNTLNLNNSQTIEFRIFSTPLTYDDFASKIQFCKALVDYAMPANLALPISEITNYANFIKWLQGNRKSYPQLAAKLKEFA